MWKKWHATIWDAPICDNSILKYFYSANSKFWSLFRSALLYIVWAYLSRVLLSGDCCFVKKQNPLITDLNKRINYANWMFFMLTRSKTFIKTALLHKYIEFYRCKSYDLPKLVLTWPRMRWWVLNYENNNLNFCKYGHKYRRKSS